MNAIKVLTVVLCACTVALQADTATTTTDATTSTTVTPRTKNSSKTTTRATTQTITTTKAFKSYVCWKGRCDGAFDCVSNTSTKLTNCTVSAPSGGCNVQIANGTVTLDCSNTCNVAKSSKTAWCCQSTNCNKQPRTQNNNAASKPTKWMIFYNMSLLFVAALAVPNL